jgi:mono/diheme cytochrome c family protein
MVPKVSRSTSWFAPALLTVALAAVSCGPKEEPAGSAVQAMADTLATAEHGAYLATVSGCHDCHTPGTLYGKPDFQRALAGSELGWTGPWGTSYARNLTPDPVTGIGAWSEEDIVHALKTGKRPDGTEILPPMPWPNLAHMKERDLKSIAKYLKSIPPVTHQNLPSAPPGQKVAGAIVLPPPSAWDAPRTQ